MEGWQLYRIKYHLPNNQGGVWFTEEVRCDEPLSYDDAHLWCERRGVVYKDHQGDDNG